MCDCYYHKCEDCERVISTHIADFCVERDVVHVLCPSCIVERVKTHREWAYQAEAYDVQIINDDDDVLEGKEGERTPVKGIIGRCVAFWCDEPGAYGIHLN